MRAILILVLSCLLLTNYTQQSLKVVSWNLHLLPAPVFAKSKKKLRTDSIINYFTQKDTSIDLLLFQEVFHSKRRDQLIEGLASLYPYHTPVVNSAKGKPFRTNSGLIIFSKTPFIQMKSIKYKDCSGNDCMAYKGAQFIHTVWNNKPILVINTHLNSEPPRSIALEQTQRIISDLAAPYINSGIPIFIGGDFNINVADSSNYKKLLSIVKSENYRHQDIVNSSTPTEVQNTLDYIFIYRDWLPNYFKVDYLYKYLIGPSWDNSDKKKIYGKTVGFSDHHAVILKLDYMK